MGLSATEKEIERLINEGGFDVQHTSKKNHRAVIIGNQKVVIGSKFGDTRAEKNALSQLRRAIKEYQEQSKAIEPKTKDKKMDLDLKHFGITEQKTEIATITRKFTIPIEALMQLIGNPEADQIILKDLEGNELYNDKGLVIEVKQLIERDCE